MSIITAKKRLISPYVIHESDRGNALSLYFESYGVSVEQLIKIEVVNLSPDLKDSYYEYVRLTNAGFFFYPDRYERCLVEVVSNGFSEILSKESVGIIACMIVYAELSYNDKSGIFLAHLSLLRDFVCERDDCSLILRAIS